MIASRCMYIYCFRVLTYLQEKYICICSRGTLTYPASTGEMTNRIWILEASLVIFMNYHIAGNFCGVLFLWKASLESNISQTCTLMLVLWV